MGATYADLENHQGCGIRRLPDGTTTTAWTAATAGAGHLLAGLRRCEVLALRLEDLRLGEWRVFIVDGKGGHERLVPISTTFFNTFATYVSTERPTDATTGAVPHPTVVSVTRCNATSGPR